MPDQGEEGNAAYSGKLGKRGQVGIFLESCSIPFMPPTFQLTDYIIFLSQLSPRVLFIQFIHFPPFVTMHY